MRKYSYVIMRNNIQTSKTSVFVFVEISCTVAVVKAIF